MRKTFILYFLISSSHSIFGQRVIHSNIGVFGNSKKINNFYSLTFSSILSKSENLTTNFKSILIRPFNFNILNVDRNKIQIEIYPNPASDILYINTNLENFTYELISSSGVKIKSGNSNSIHTNDIASGIYFITIYNNSNKIESKKVIIQK